MSKKISYILTLSTVAGLLILYFAHSSFQEFLNETWDILWSNDEEKISAHFESFGFWGPVAIIIVMILQIFLVVFPSWLPMIVAVLAYGFWGGALISIAGVYCASTIAFYLGKWLGEDNLEKVMGKSKNKKVEYWVSEYGFWTIAIFRISPFLSNDAISIIAGMLSMKYRKFILATLTGIIPLSFAIAYFGQDTTSLKNGLYWIGGAGIVIYGLYVYIDYRKRKK
ncbi:VTT domain-containing protein [Pontixanthobacter gangjinensis]|uniref:TVP38/TMEM64 family membrane protein n=1 Tax=Christiangramia aestuarii TaxID=1028746 RepID=A0A7M3SXC5_9FLAO|nr:TVP38/TMEM64 family protein [Christiangramia aestuarii]MUP41256.1 VTT domain-containing protein [Christiangramia aestuarii]